MARLTSFARGEDEDVEPWYMDGMGEERRAQHYVIDRRDVDAIDAMPSLLACLQHRQ